MGGSRQNGFDLGTARAATPRHRRPSQHAWRSAAGGLAVTVALLAAGELIAWLAAKSHLWDEALARRNANGDRPAAPREDGS